MVYVDSKTLILLVESIKCLLFKDPANHLTQEC